MTADGGYSQKSFRFRRGWRFLFGLFLSLLTLLWLVFTTDWPATWQALSTANISLILLASGLALATIPMRSGRWRLMFRKTNRPPFLQLTAVMLIGQAINVFLPGRLGELVQISLVKEEHAAYILGTQILRLTIDMFMLALVVILLLFRPNLPQWWRGPGEALLTMTLFAVLGIGALIVCRRPLLRFSIRIRQRWSSARWRSAFEGAEAFLRSLDTMAKPSLLVALIIFSLLIWILYTIINYVLLAAVGIPASWLMALFMLAVLLLGIVVPSSPGRVGVYHYLAVQALAFFNVSQSTALSFAILSHLITIILPAALGAILTWRSGISLRSSWAGKEKFNV